MKPGDALGRERQYRPCISINALCWSASSVKRTKPYPLLTPVTGSSIILALLQLKNGLINLGSLSFLRPNTGFRNTATRSLLDASGARSPTKIEYSLGKAGWGVELGGEVGTEAPDAGAGTALAHLRLNCLAELGIVAAVVDICARTAAACPGEGNVRKQYPGLFACIRRSKE